MSKHTPGPWTVAPLGTIEFKGGFIGEAYDSNPGYYGEKCEDLPVMENARLMAAAPEMFDALRDLYNALVLQSIPSDTAWQKSITLYEKLTAEWK